MARCDCEYFAKADFEQERTGRGSQGPGGAGCSRNRTRVPPFRLYGTVFKNLTFPDSPFSA